MLHISNFLLGHSFVTESCHFGLVFGKASSEQHCYRYKSATKNINATPDLISSINTMPNLVEVSFVLFVDEDQNKLIAVRPFNKAK